MTANIRITSLNFQTTIVENYVYLIGGKKEISIVFESSNSDVTQLQWQSFHEYKNCNLYHLPVIFNIKTTSSKNKILQ